MFSLVYGLRTTKYKPCEYNFETLFNKNKFQQVLTSFKMCEKVWDLFDLNPALSAGVPLVSYITGLNYIYIWFELSPKLLGRFS